MKGKRRWTRWYTDRLGFSGNDWAETWLSDLKAADLPGPDFVIRAANGAMDQWLDRPADYTDTRRALHFTLMLACSFSAAEAVQFNPHSFRHILVSVGAQLRGQNIVDERDSERLGHWSKGSAMPDKYDSAAGVSELRARSALLGAVRNGWRPAADGNLPPPIASSLLPCGSGRRFVDSVVGTGCAPTSPSSQLCSVAGPSSQHCSVAGGPVPVVTNRGPDPGPSSLVPRDHARREALPSPTPVSGGSPVRSEGSQRGGALKRACTSGPTVPSTGLVAHTKSRRVHVRGPCSVRTVCKAWTCGSESQPSSDALVLDAPNGWSMCRICFR